MSDPLEQAATLLSDAARVVTLTGAGMSQESGVPTFRDALTGLWARYDPQELATEAGFRSDPARVFGWYLTRLYLTRQVEPHAGHRALVELAGVFDEFVVLTQNVDGLHRRAGSGDVIELHGSLDAFRCFDRGHPFDARRLEQQWMRSLGGAVEPPPCPECGSPIRPGVVWFGEVLPVAVVERAREVVEWCDVLLVVGTSALVYPAADLPRGALARGAAVIEINPDRTPLSSSVELCWPARAGTALPALAERLGRRVPR